MPYGRAYPAISKSSGSLKIGKIYKKFKRFFNNLMPFVQENYRIKEGKDNYAIAGFPAAAENFISQFE